MYVYVSNIVASNQMTVTIRFALLNSTLARSIDLTTVPSLPSARRVAAGRQRLMKKGGGGQQQAPADTLGTMAAAAGAVKKKASFRLKKKRDTSLVQTEDESSESAYRR